MPQTGKQKSKEEKTMIPISKKQAAYLRDQLPGVHITTLCRKKSNGARKRRLAEECSAVQRALARFEQAQAETR